MQKKDSFSKLLVVIPAIKKNAVIPDQLIKKLNGITLIQRAINTALEVVKKENILVVTDSIEISLICERNDIKYYLDKELNLVSENILEVVNNIVKNSPETDILIYRANTPLVDSNLLKDAYLEFTKDSRFILGSFKQKQKKVFIIEEENFKRVPQKNLLQEIKAFYIFNKNHFKEMLFKPFLIENEKSIEIDGYQSWWVCEKVLQRKRLVFNVIGDTKIGMGHIYHSLALAHEITDHEVIFICDEKYSLAVNQIATKDYQVYPTKNTLETILELNPDLVINDILNTDKEFIKTIKNNNIKVVNFEDLGEGSKYADLVFNELFDEPQLEGKNYLWGHEYLALRDEFYEATPHSMIEQIDTVLITFGGTDQNNLTLKTLKAILPICKQNSININIVCGSAYDFKSELEEFLDSCDYKHINLTYSSGVISKIMEKSQLAISSNGRTVYELADMNIPSIVISHHKREATHTFATLDKGFINLGVVSSEIEIKIEEKFEKLISDRDYRELLFMNIKKYSFRENKQKVVKKIMELLN